QTDQRAQALQAAARIMDRVRDVVLTGELFLGEVNLLERDATHLLRQRLLQFEPIGHLSRTPVQRSKQHVFPIAKLASGRRQAREQPRITLDLLAHKVQYGRIVIFHRKVASQAAASRRGCRDTTSNTATVNIEARTNRVIRGARGLPYSPS